MPGLDQTGPQGKGSMTGRRAGRCANAGSAAKKSEGPDSQPKESNLPGSFAGGGKGQGLGRGRGGRGSGLGRGQGMQNRFRGSV